jgi:hypothetical protein
VSAPTARVSESGAVELDCGHQVLLPWGIVPEVAAVVLELHRRECPRVDSPVGPGPVGPWSVRRLEAYR